MALNRQMRNSDFKSSGYIRLKTCRVRERERNKILQKKKEKRREKLSRAACKLHELSALFLLLLKIFRINKIFFFFLRRKKNSLGFL